MSDPIRAYVVANARYHDTDFARLELLKLLAEDPEIRTRVSDDFSDVDTIARSDFLVTYTCDLRPTPEEQVALGEFLNDGGRWFALHATNAILEFVDGGKVDTPDLAPDFMKLLGSRFVAHPSNRNFTVRPSHEGYVQADYGTDRDSHPQMYLHPWGGGEVLYLSLGHCAGKHDMKPMVDEFPVVRGSWNSPVYYELLRRGIRWGIGAL